MNSPFRSLAAAVVAVTALVSAGCQPSARESGPVADSSADVLEPAPGLAAAEASLMTGTWMWVGTNRPTDRVEPNDPTKYTIAFQSDSLAAVQADCNQGSGRYTLVEGGKIELEPVTTTQMGCPEGSSDTEYLRQLGAVEAWGVQGDTLSLALELGGGTMRFVRRP
jgi:heat shock protein HslJ